MNKVVATVLIGWTLGCAGSDRAASEAKGDPAVGPAASQPLMKGTPAGGLEEWVAEIMKGLDGISARAVEDLPEAQREALDLYVGRQEYIEMYWGEQGRLLTPGHEDLGVSVMAAEAAFHRLLQTLVAVPLDTVELNVDLDTLKATINRVLTLAESSGVALVPPGSGAR